MGEQHEMREQAAIAVEEALRHRTVGLFRSGMHKWQGLGSGTLVEWNGRQLVLTAWHVIDGTAQERLRFFLPAKGIPQNVDRETLLSLKGALPSQLADLSELEIRGIEADAHAKIDLAALDISGSLRGHEIARFFTIAPGGTTPPERGLISCLGASLSTSPESRLITSGWGSWPSIGPIS